ncbi:hypothetical protein [Variovorax sp. GT1P44]|uniref:hypothetical protein n=1 Tax=Variovorax sp. GT1P44 TaxID=3443742 RepID=UPI003F462A73
MSLPYASPLHAEFHVAIEANDATALNRLLQAHGQEVVEQFGAWLNVPAAIRADKAAVNLYVDSLFRIARLFDQVGEPSLLRRMVGEDKDNPIVRWQRRLSNAQALSAGGEHGASDVELDAVLQEMEGATGNAVDDLRPKVLGTLGTNALHRGDYAAALGFTQRAHDACMASGDEGGRVAYYENLVSLRVIDALANAPEAGQRALHVRRLVVSAQDAADAGRYETSRHRLVEALSVIEGHPGDALLAALSPKVLGLMGFDEHRLGNAVKARECTARAVAGAEAVGDIESVRVYKANLDALGAP